MTVVVRSYGSRAREPSAAVLVVPAAVLVVPPSVAVAGGVDPA
jgi:hypothetical protein